MDDKQVKKTKIGTRWRCSSCEAFVKKEDKNCWSCEVEFENGELIEEIKKEPTQIIEKETEVIEEQYDPNNVVSALPRMMIGYFLVIVLFFTEGSEYEIILRGEIPPKAFLVGFINLAYWMFCIHRFHKIMAEYTSNSYPFKPAPAVFSHFIPLYNLYWIFKWPIELSKFVNQHSSAKIVTYVPIENKQ